MAVLTDMETQLLDLLQPLVLDGAVKTVRPFVAGDDIDPNDDEISKVLEGIDSAVFVTINGSDIERVTGRTKLDETVNITLTAYVANKAAQDATTRGDARRLGIYDLVALVRARVENQPIVNNPGNRYVFAGHERSGYATGKLTWAIYYEARVTTEIDPEDTDELYAKILGRVFLVEPPATNPSPVEFQRDLETT